MPNNNRKTSPVTLPYYLGAIISLGTCLLIVSLMTGIGWWRSLIVAIGAVVLIWGILFSILEIRRNAGLARTERTAEELEAFRNPHRQVTVEPPTNEATPHHEDHPGSEGRDQGQLTSHWPVPTPLVDRLIHSEHSGKKETS